MVEQRVVDFFHQPQRAHVADAREIAVAHAIQNREPEAHERDVFHAGNVFAVGVADDEVHRVVLDLLVQLEQIHVLLHHRVGRVVGENVREALFKMFAGRAGEDIGGLHVQFHQELRERDDVVGIADDGHAFAVEILVHVAHGVEQATAFLANAGGHIHAAVVAERMDEVVGVRQAVGQFQQRAGHLAFFVQLDGRRMRGEVAEGNRADAVAGGFDLFDGRAAAGKHPVLAVLRQIQHAAGVGEHHGFHAHFLDDALEFAHVGGVNVAGNDVQLRLGFQLRFGLAAGFGEVFHHAGDHAGEAGDVRADEARRVRVDDVFAFGNDFFLLGLLDHHRNVVADDFGQTGRVNRDNLRIVNREDVGQRLGHVGQAAEHGRAFGERTRRGDDRFLEVARQMAAVIRAAALRTVAVRHAAVDAERGIHRADGLAGLGGIDPQRLARFDFSSGSVKHNFVWLKVESWLHRLSASAAPALRQALVSFFASVLVVCVSAWRTADLFPTAA